MSRLVVLVALACAVATDASCPLDFPFPSPPHSNIICYNTAAFASAGSGTCGSWCTQDVAIGGGCGSNAQRICAESAPVRAAKIQVKDSHAWFKHNSENNPAWSECSTTFCKYIQGETEVFSHSFSDTQYLRRSDGPIDRSIQSRNRAKLNDNRNFGDEHWHCEQDSSHADGCKCMCSDDNNCYSVKHSDRFVKKCDGEDVTVQYTASKNHKDVIAAIDANLPQPPTATLCEDSCHPDGTYTGAGDPAGCTAQYCTQYESGGVFHDRCTVGHPGHNYALEECQQTCGICSTATASSIQWILDPRTPRGAQSCTTVCADVSETCDQPSLDNLNNNDAAFAAAFDAWKPGHCNNWNTGCTGGNNCAAWGSPFIHSSHVKDHLCWKGSPVADCGQRPVDGHHRRLCPCN